MQFITSTLSQATLRFRRWSRNRFAAFFSLGRHVVIGQLKNNIANASLNKQSFAYGVVESAKEFFFNDQEEPGIDELSDFLIPENNLNIPIIFTSVSSYSDVNFRIHTNKASSASMSVFKPA